MHTHVHTQLKIEEPGMVVQSFNPDDKEAETDKSLSPRPGWST